MDVRIVAQYCRSIIGYLQVIVVVHLLTETCVAHSSTRLTLYLKNLLILLSF